MRGLIWVALLALGGCATSAPTGPWFVDTDYDVFTDDQACRVTVASRYAGGSAFTKTGKLYPYVQWDDLGLSVGVRSGGKYLVPVGDVQLRIDANKAWTITTTETPGEGPHDALAETIKADYDNLPPEQKEAAIEAFNRTYALTAKATLPYTAAGGDKALAILEELEQGSRLIYRATGPLQNDRNFGEFELNNSLHESLALCREWATLRRP